MGVSTHYSAASSSDDAKYLGILGHRNVTVGDQSITSVIGNPYHLVNVNTTTWLQSYRSSGSGLQVVAIARSSDTLNAPGTPLSVSGASSGYSYGLIKHPADSTKVIMLYVDNSANINLVVLAVSGTTVTIPSSALSLGAVEGHPNLCVSPDGSIWVIDQTGGTTIRVRKFSVSTNTITLTSTSTITGTFGGSIRAASVVANDRLVFANTQQIGVFSHSGTTLTELVLQDRAESSGIIAYRNTENLEQLAGATFSNGDAIFVVPQLTADGQFIMTEYYYDRSAVSLTLTSPVPNGASEASVFVTRQSIDGATSGTDPYPRLSNSGPNGSGSFSDKILANMFATGISYGTYVKQNKAADGAYSMEGPVRRFMSSAGTTRKECAVSDSTYSHMLYSRIAGSTLSFSLIKSAEAV